MERLLRVCDIYKAVLVVEETKTRGLWRDERVHNDGWKCSSKGEGLVEEMVQQQVGPSAITSHEPTRAVKSC